MVSEILAYYLAPILTGIISGIIASYLVGRFTTPQLVTIFSEQRLETLEIFFQNLSSMKIWLDAFYVRFEKEVWKISANTNGVIPDFDLPLDKKTTLKTMLDNASNEYEKLRLEITSDNMKRLVQPSFISNMAYYMWLNTKYATSLLDGYHDISAAKDIQSRARKIIHYAQNDKDKRLKSSPNIKKFIDDWAKMGVS